MPYIFNDTVNAGVVDYLIDRIDKGKVSKFGPYVLDEAANAKLIDRLVKQINADGSNVAGLAPHIFNHGVNSGLVTHLAEQITKGDFQHLEEHIFIDDNVEALLDHL